MNLSKSLYIRGLQCNKSLWLYKHLPKLRTPPSEELQARFDKGHEIGALARDLFPGGKNIDIEGKTFPHKLHLTKKYIKQLEPVIYEASFSYDQIFVMADILIYKEDGWELYEVKSSTEIKPVHINDLSIQYYVLTGFGLPISKACIVHTNPTNIINAKSDITDKFVIVDILKEAIIKNEEIKSDISHLRKMIRTQSIPNIKPGKQCTTPYECDFINFCNKSQKQMTLFS